MPRHLRHNWPKNEENKPIPPAFLMHLPARDLQTEIALSLLDTAGIPAITELPSGGSFGRVILGFSGTGTDIFVPETMVEEAKALLNADIIEEGVDG